MSIEELLSKLETCKKLDDFTADELNIGDKATDDLIRKNMFFINESTIYFYQVKKHTKHTISITRNYLRELAKDIGAFNFVIDISRATRPNAETREEIRVNFLKDLNVKHVFIFTGENIMMKLTTKLIMNTLDSKYIVSYIKTREEVNELPRGRAIEVSKQSELIRM